MPAQAKILLVSSRPAQLEEFIQALSNNGRMAIVTVDTATAAMATVKEVLPVLAVVDDQVYGVAGLDIIRRLINVNAFMQTVAISELSDQDFHNCSEGLGILLKLPLLPGKNDARNLIAQLESVTANAV